ncbi:MAG: hypothetical protein P4L80_13040 [Xanthobacteraceae bacterium]|nr:hypothetical protein [Xanthobacteraceae bacterium]
MKSAVIHGDTPRRFPALTNGASVMAMTAADEIGSRKARPT